MAEYQLTANEVFAILDPSMALQVKGELKTKRRPRCTKIYRHPGTGATIETRGANHKLLKQWKAEYGAATVESWLQL
ncbi:histone-like nucleoid-structuring protein, MvaT/MvaU family [Pseudomonas oryzihabitans]|uniref:histone-like nucleoid-structuring protein, MvaT/MvaU family n=1 Tax=Pseudomonas oryzihabitans TaxID=47885 RepID=UPI003EB6DEB8